MALIKRNPVAAGQEKQYKNSQIPLFFEKHGFRHVLLEVKYNVCLFAVFSSENIHFQVFKVMSGKGYPGDAAFFGSDRWAWSFIDHEKAYKKFFELVGREACHE